MTQQVYHDKILEPVVKQWKDEGWDFTLEEDNDSGHGTLSANNICARHKQVNGIRCLHNAPYSPDLAIIETCWSAPKHEMKKHPHFDDETTKQLILEGWNRLSYEGVNEMVLSIPKRLKDVKKLKGQMTAY